MAAPLLSRTLRPSIPSIPTSNFVCPSCQRLESTYRRTRRALRVKPDPSFLPSKTEPQDHIIFNPPSSAPNVYHTPKLFLPASDPRRKLHSLAAQARSASLPSTSSTLTTSTAHPQPTASARHLPAVRPQYQKKYHLGESQIEEMRRLRTADPRTWTRVRLAEKFECSQFFVSLVCATSPEILAERERALEAVKKRWGRRKVEAREDRQVRKSGWGMDV